MNTWRKNVSGQKLPFALVAAADGSALTGATVTAYVSKDGAAQATPGGSVSELANGQYVFSPSQGDTNATVIGVLMTATGAVPVHFTVYTTLQDTTSAVVAANVTQSLGVALQNKDFTVASATSSTVTLPTAYANSVTLPNDASHAGKVLQVVAGTGEGQIVRLLSRVGSTREWNVAGMTTQLDNTSECVVVGTALADAAGVRTAVGLGSANLDTQLGNIATDAGNAATNSSNAQSTSADSLIVLQKLDDTLEDNAGTYRFTSAALAEGPGGGSAPTAGEIADAVWDVAGTTAGWA